MVILRTLEEGCQGRRIGPLPFLVMSGNPLDALIADARALCQNESPQQARLDPVGIRVLRLKRSASPFYPSPFTHLRLQGSDGQWQTTY